VARLLLIVGPIFLFAFAFVAPLQLLLMLLLMLMMLLLMMKQRGRGRFRRRGRVKGGRLVRLRTLDRQLVTTQKFLEDLELESIFFN
jgi:hypothetical protein